VGKVTAASNRGALQRTVDRSVLAQAADLAPASLPALDAIHLACALSLRERLSAFVAYDERLRDAGRAAGLEVGSPS
jgi:predicted nucleic acid-binding protein